MARKDWQDHGQDRIAGDIESLVLPPSTTSVVRRVGTSNEVVVTFWPNPQLHIASPARFRLKVPMTYPSVPPVVVCETPAVLEGITIACPKRDGGDALGTPSAAAVAIASAQIPRPPSGGRSGGSASGPSVTMMPLLDAERRPRLNILSVGTASLGWTRVYTVSDVLFGLYQSMQTNLFPVPYWMSPTREGPDQAGSGDPWAVEQRSAAEGNAAALAALQQASQLVLRGAMHDVKTLSLQFGHCSKQGRRHTMEDRWSAVPVLALPRPPSSKQGSQRTTGAPQGRVVRWEGGKTSLFAVFDGHGGDGAAQYASMRLHEFVAARLAETRDVCLALWLGLQDTDKHLIAAAKGLPPPSPPPLMHYLTSARRSHTGNSPSLDDTAALDALHSARSRSSSTAEDHRARNGGSATPGASQPGSARAQPREAARSSRSQSREGARSATPLMSLFPLTPTPRAEGGGVAAPSQSPMADDDEDDDSPLSASDSLVPPPGHSRKPSRRGRFSSLRLSLDDVGIGRGIDESGCTAVVALLAEVSVDPLQHVMAAHTWGRPPSMPSPAPSGFRTAASPPAAGASAEATGVRFDTDAGSDKRGLALTIANVGDSRAVLSRGGRAVSLSRDHKATDPAERARIAAAGGMIFHNRVLGRLAVTRALGDPGLKEGTMGLALVTPEPDLFSTFVYPEDEFLLMTCDGVFESDIMDPQEAIDIARLALVGGKTPDEAADLVASEAFARGSKDNITAVVIMLSDAVPARAHAHSPARPQPAVQLHQPASELTAGLRFQLPSGPPPSRRRKAASVVTEDAEEAAHAATAAATGQPLLVGIAVGIGNDNDDDDDDDDDMNPAFAVTKPRRPAASGTPVAMPAGSGSISWSVDSPGHLSSRSSGSRGAGSSPSAAGTPAKSVGSAESPSLSMRRNTAASAVATGLLGGTARGARHSAAPAAGRPPATTRAGAGSFGFRASGAQTRRAAQAPGGFFGGGDSPQAGSSRSSASNGPGNAASSTFAAGSPADSPALFSPTFRRQGGRAARLDAVPGEHDTAMAGANGAGSGGGRPSPVSARQATGGGQPGVVAAAAPGSPGGGIRSFLAEAEDLLGSGPQRS